GSRDQVGSQYSYSYSIEEDPRTYDEAMQSWDAAFWKEAINDEIGSIIENDTWVLSDLPPGCKPLGCKWIFKIARITTIRLLLALVVVHNLVIYQMDVKTTFLNGDLDEEVYKKQPKGFVMPGEADVILGIKIKRKNKRIVITHSHYIDKILKKFNHEDYSPVSTPMDPVEKIKPNTGKLVDHLEYSRAIGRLMYDMISTRPDIAYKVGRLRLGSNNKGVQCMGVPAWGGAILWASKKQTCITGSTMEYEFVALAAACKEAEWLRNLIHEIQICPKSITPISIHCDSAATLAKAYSQMYNGKSRHLGVRHSMIKELIMNGVISIEFVRSQQNLADHLTKGLARDLVNNAATLAKAYSQMYNGKSRHLGVRHSMIRELIMNDVISIEFVWPQQNIADYLTKGLARDLVNKSLIWMELKSI
nr:zinc finger, CCHC-type [Tanacetum cinerariifolium]